MLAALGVFTLSCAVSALATLTFQILWAWFIAPFGLPPLGYWKAFGVFLFMGFSMRRLADLFELRNPSTFEEDAKRLALAGVSCAFALMFGFLAHCMGG